MGNAKRRGFIIDNRIAILKKRTHASVQKVPNENMSLNSRRCKILVCRYHYRKAWYLIDL